MQIELRNDTETDRIVNSIIVAGRAYDVAEHDGDQQAKHAARGRLRKHIGTMWRHIYGAKKRQKEIPGTERQSIPEIDEAALAYVEARDERMALTDREVEQRELLLRRMTEHKQETYKFVDGETEFRVDLAQPAVKPKVSKKSVAPAE
jgi:translation elongation factor P/translation initiation factor 5A